MHISQVVSTLSISVSYFKRTVDSGQCHHNRFSQSRQSSPGWEREDPRYLQIVTERSVMIYVDLAIIIQTEIINGIING